MHVGTEPRVPLVDFGPDTTIACNLFYKHDSVIATPCGEFHQVAIYDHTHIYPELVVSYTRSNDVKLEAVRTFGFGVEILSSLLA